MMVDSSANSKEKACSLFKKHFDNLTTGLKDHLPMLVSQLYSSELVSSDTRDKIIDTGNNTDSRIKCMCLLKDVEERIKSDHSALEKFCEVLCHQNIGLAHLGEPLRDDFRQVCHSDSLAKPTFHGNYNAPGEDTPVFIEPASESQVDVASNGRSARQTEESLVKHDGGCDDEKMSTFIKSFETLHQVHADGNNGGNDGELEQMVPVNESCQPKRGKTFPYIDLDSGCFTAHQSFRDQELEEKALVSDMVVSWDRITQRCERCAAIQATYETKLENMKEYYTKLLEGGTARPASVQRIKTLEDDKQHLLRVLDLKTEEKLKQLKEKEEEIDELQHQVDTLQARLHRKKKEQEELKASLSANEKELHKVKKLGSHCPIYGSEEKLADFKQKLELCKEIQSLVAQFFVSGNPDEKTRLQERIQPKFSRLTSLERRNSFSL